MDLEVPLRKGQYAQVLVSEKAEGLLQAFVKATVQRDAGAGEPQQVESSHPERTTQVCDGSVAVAVAVGLGALAAFLQANVTGPVVESARRVEDLFGRLEQTIGATLPLRQACLSSLSVDGVSVYPYISHIELFCLARWIFLIYLSGDSLPSRSDTESDAESEDTDPAEGSLAWLRLRVHTWHYKLLTEPNPGPGSVFNKMTQWSDLPSLQELIQQCLDDVGKQLDADTTWTRKSRVQFLLEKTNVYTMLGMDGKAQESLDEAAKLHRFEYVLSGALGKRTRFQDKSTSQLVILAKSAPDSDAGLGREANAEKAETAEAPVPRALPLNNDTLLESIDFSEAKNDTKYGDTDKATNAQQQASPNANAMPLSLRELAPDDQPQLSPLDQIILLSVATLKDAFSPADSLTLEEILPYATRVLSDKKTNWQIYSQALIVRSRIELHRSRTVERGVLQMQAVVDQVVETATDTTGTTKPGVEVDVSTPSAEIGTETAIPTIQVSAPGEVAKINPPTSFFPAPKATEQAPPQIRLRYIDALSTPPLWHLESELAFAWAGIGSLVSALEIFKRLRLWAEVALCLATSSAVDDEGGRGAGGEEKARALVRWQLFCASDPASEPKGGHDGGEIDVLTLRSSDFDGPERDPPPPNAPRLFCILGDIESEPKHYERAWALSKGHYSRAQRSLGEHYLQQQDWNKARDAYQKAVGANRLNPQLWSRLGDINLRLGLFSDAAEAFSRAISAAGDAVGGEDARTWSNLGSALYSLYTETMKEQRGAAKKKQESGDEQAIQKTQDEKHTGDHDDKEDTEVQTQRDKPGKRDPATLLSQSLAAFKRGATISHGNWRIWDNVVTVASRLRPPAVVDIILALHNILAVRNTEDAVDINVVRLLLNETVLAKPKPAKDGVPPRGSQEKAVCDMVENVIVPLITRRSELWELVTRERLWRGDLAGAIDAAEKGWRAAVGGAASSGSLGSTMAAARGSSSGRQDDDKSNWLENAEAWESVVARTDELVSVLENYGPDVPTVGSRWKMKARSALRSVMSKGRERWEGDPGWTTLESLLEGLR